MWWKQKLVNNLGTNEQLDHINKRHVIVHDWPQSYNNEIKAPSNACILVLIPIKSCKQCCKIKCPEKAGLKCVRSHSPHRWMYENNINELKMNQYFLPLKYCFLIFLNARERIYVEVTLPFWPKLGFHIWCRSQSKHCYYTK